MIVIDNKILTRRSMLGAMTAIPAAALFTGAVPAFASSSGAATYYVDPNGSDGNSGTATESPWRTLAKVNSIMLQAGDKVLFKSGGIFAGQLVPRASATSADPAIYGSYGPGSRPLIMGDGAGRRKMYSGYVESVIYIYNTQNIEIQGLAVTSNQTDTSTFRAGVYIRNYDAGLLTHVTVKNCEIYGIASVVNGDDGRFFGGIFINQYSDDDTANFDDLRLDSNYIHDVDMAAVYIQAYDETRGAWDHPNTAKSTNVVVSNNTVSATGGDGIVVNFTARGIVEHNVASNVTTHNVAAFAAIWTACSDDIKIQYNEVYGTNISEDGMAFDDDLYTNRSIFQYNYSHNNSGGFFQSMMSGKDYIVRYNVSHDDSTRIFRRPYVGKHYNNVIVLGSTYSTPMTADKIDAASEFYNNIVYVLGNTSYPASGGVWSSNNFYGAHPMDEPADFSKVISDPIFANPGGAGPGITTAEAYKLQITSPVIGRAKDVGYGGNLDFFGNVVPTGCHNIGIDEFYAIGGPQVLVLNSGFEVGSPTQTPAGWSSYSASGSTSASYTESNGGAHSGDYHLTNYSSSGTWDVYTYQTVSDLPDGTYTLSAWAKRFGSGFNACELQVKLPGAGPVTTVVPDSSVWQQVKISTIGVTNGQIEIGLWTDVVNGGGSAYVYLDDVSLKKN